MSKFFEQTLKFGMALGKLAARDPEVHRLTSEVQHLLKPRRAYQDPIWCSACWP